ncbi:LOW QUALITY PROTEIN: zinc finger protein ZXDC [Rhynchocyon petersi]
MDTQGLPASRAAGERPHGGPGPAPGWFRRLSPGPGRRRLLLLCGSEDGGPEPQREQAPVGPELSLPASGDAASDGSFVVLLEVARGTPEAPDQARDGHGAAPAVRSGQGPSRRPAAPSPAAALAGALAVSGQDLLVRLDNGVFTLASPPLPGNPPTPPGAGPPAPASGQDPTSAPEGRRGSAGAPGYPCPEPQCAQAFARKHQLKVHLLTHGDSQGRRPFKCPLDGCGWAFTTSYKLKRHLQSHDKLRPFSCPVGACGKKFTTIYNLKAHMKGHEQENLFKCEVCAERFPTHAKLSSHQRSHFEPERPYKCDFPGCEKTFITVSALFSHNRAHFREQELFSCSFPGCSKQYDKACRLKIHLRSHTGERPFVCDSDSCGWTFTSMSKLLRHKRKHDDDRRFTCPVEGCGKSFTRAEHLKGHSITHLGTKPFVCPVEGCCARFSARSSLYIHSKKHLQDVNTSKSRCPVSSCNRQFTSKHSMKTHVAKQHNLRQDLLSQLEASSSLTPSSELTSPGQNELNNIDLVSLFSNAAGDSNSSAVASDMALVNSGILTIDVTSVNASLGGNLPVNNSSLGQMDPLVLVANSDISPSLDSPLMLGSMATVLQQSNLSSDDVQTVSSEALGCLVSLPVKNLSQDTHALTSSNNSALGICTSVSSDSPSGNSCIPDLLAHIKVEPSLPPDPDVGLQASGKVDPRFVLSTHAENCSAQKETDLSAVPGNLYLESEGSARTDYRAIQLAKKKKQKGAGSVAGSPGPDEKKKKGNKISPSHFHASQSSGLCGEVVPCRGLMGPEPAARVQCVQAQLLQDDSPGEAILPLALSSQQPLLCLLTMDLPVYVLRAPYSSLSSFLELLVTF